MCPKCGGELVPRSHASVETHGLDCGPYEHFYEEWWECLGCGEKLTEEEARAASDTQVS